MERGDLSESIRAIIAAREVELREIDTELLSVDNITPPDLDVSFAWMDKKIADIGKLFGSNTVSDKNQDRITSMNRELRRLLPDRMTVTSRPIGDHVEFEIKGAARLTTSVMPLGALGATLKGF